MVAENDKSTPFCPYTAPPPKKSKVLNLHTQPQNSLERSQKRTRKAKKLSQGRRRGYPRTQGSSGDSCCRAASDNNRIASSRCSLAGDGVTRHNFLRRGREVVYTLRPPHGRNFVVRSPHPCRAIFKRGVCVCVCVCEMWPCTNVGDWRSGRSCPSKVSSARQLQAWVACLHWCGRQAQCEPVPRAWQRWEEQFEEGEAHCAALWLLPVRGLEEDSYHHRRLLWAGPRSC